MANGQDDRKKKIKSFSDLIAWQKARGLVKNVYTASGSFPRHEMFALTSQMRRAAISVPSNIAEGYGRGSLQDYIRFLQTARGSLYELQTQVVLAVDLEYLTRETARQLYAEIDECSRTLQGLISSLNRAKQGSV